MREDICVSFPRHWRYGVAHFAFRTILVTAYTLADPRGEEVVQTTTFPSPSLLVFNTFRTNSAKHVGHSISPLYSLPLYSPEDSSVFATTYSLIVIPRFYPLSNRSPFISFLSEIKFSRDVSTELFFFLRFSRFRLAELLKLAKDT